MRKYYFDYAATTPVDKRVVKATEPYYAGVFGNPGSRHKFGQEASAAVFKARNKIAKLIGCDYREIIFTGSATESNNLAIRGIIKNFYNQRITNQREFTNKKEIDKNRISAFVKIRNSLVKPRIIISAIEHESVLETCRDLEKEGLVEVIYLPVFKNGIVDLKKIKTALDERTVLVSIMYANNEMGAIQPIKEISEIIKEFKITRHCEESATLLRVKLRTGEAWQSEKRNRLLRLLRNDRFIHNSLFPLFHTDAAQAFNYLNCDVKNLAKSAESGSPEHFAKQNVLGGVDMMTLSSQKIYGPKGVGLLYARRIMNNELRIVNGERIIHNSPFYIHPLITGGGQEEGLRSGTENIAGIVGMSEAAELIAHSREWENDRLARLQNYFLDKLEFIKKSKFILNGPKNGETRLPNNINIYFPGKKDLIFKLDMAGFAVSGGSACSARLAKPSYVLKALGCSDEKASESIRISFGRQTTKQSIDKLLSVFKKILKS